MSRVPSADPSPKKKTDWATIRNDRPMPAVVRESFARRA